MKKSDKIMNYRVIPHIAKKYTIILAILFFAINCIGQSGSITINPSKDTWLNGDSQDTNYGLSSEIRIDREATKEERALVHFVIPSLPSLWRNNNLCVFETDQNKR